MPLSRLAQQFADEIRQHDWSDAPYRTDRAGHRRESDTSTRPGVPQLDKAGTDAIRMNVMWVTAQVLGYNDPNLDVYEFAEACGVETRTPSGYPKSGVITAGLRSKLQGGGYARPGTWDGE